MITLRTERLVLRGWTDSDRPAFANLNGDLRVMEFLPGPLSPRESDELFDKIQSHIRAHGFGLYAVELPRKCSFIGYIGLAIPSFKAKFTPCVEIGWRLAAEHWNQGLATEGARAVVRHAFENLGIPELVSFTVPANNPSRRVMEKLGMTRDPAEDFEHPRLPEGHPLRRHVLYRLRREQFCERR
jgi:RimJ/RimL family protein N-acetyltransferase